LLNGVEQSRRNEHLVRRGRGQPFRDGVREYAFKISRFISRLKSHSISRSFWKNVASKMAETLELAR
jgi:hypothetical protein